MLVRILLAALASVPSLAAQTERLDALLARVGEPPAAAGTPSERRAADAGRLRELRELPALLDAAHVPDLVARARLEHSPEVLALCVRAIGSTGSRAADDWILATATWANGERVVRESARVLASSMSTPSRVAALRTLLATAPSPKARLDLLDNWATASHAADVGDLLLAEYRTTVDPLERERLAAHLGRCGAVELAPAVRTEIARADDPQLRARLLRSLGRLDRLAAHDEARRILAAHADAELMRAALDKLVLQGDREVLPFVVGADSPCSLRWWGCARLRDALDRIPLADRDETRSVAVRLQRAAGPLLRVVAAKAGADAWMLFHPGTENGSPSLLELIEPLDQQLCAVDLVFLYEQTGACPDNPSWKPDWILAWGSTEPEWTITFGPRSEWLQQRDRLIARLRAK